MAASDYMPQTYPDLNSQSEVSEWTGNNKWNAIYTVQLGELIEKGVFDWSLDILDWSSAAYSTEQYKRVCDYFIERFRFREISIEPFYEWATLLHRKLAYELMPKYRIMYAFLDDSFDIAQDHSKKSSEAGNLDRATTGNKDDYFKRRAVGSDYPETLLSGNSDYVSNGQDEESEGITDTKGTQVDSTTTNYQDVERANLLDSYLRYEQEFTAIDKSLLNQLESMFFGLYTVAIDGM